MTEETTPTRSQTDKSSHKKSEENTEINSKNEGKISNAIPISESKVNGVQINVHERNVLTLMDLDSCEKRVKLEKQNLMPNAFQLKVMVRDVMENMN